MKKETERKILFVINPKSGLPKFADYQNIISEIGNKEGFKWEIFETTGKDDPENIRNHIKRFNPDTVIAVGGDGTVNIVAIELLGKGIKLGIIPLGSANGLAYNLGIPDNFRRALNFNLQKEAGAMDVIKINDRHFCLHLSDVGINARIVKRFEKEGSKGLLGYGKQLFKELGEGKTYFHSYIEVPGKRRKKMNAEMIVIANAKSFGTGAIINPTGKINDGQFEIVVIRPYPWWFVFTFAFASFIGKVHKMEYVKVYSAKEAKITLPKNQEYQVDGEIVPETGLLKVEIMPGVLNVIGVE